MRVILVVDRRTHSTDSLYEALYTGVVVMALEKSRHYFFTIHHNDSLVEFNEYTQ